ncbi:MAG: hypothetical protein FWE36_05920 [Erysipelotrichales bacterium]|jgi:hypothetical protein|nr:hypothetical protein [Erysipelotrichales bacterium]
MKLIAKCLIGVLALLVSSALLLRGGNEVEAQTEVFTGWQVTANGVNYELYNVGSTTVFRSNGVIVSHNSITIVAPFFDVTYIDTGEHGTLTPVGRIDIFATALSPEGVIPVLFNQRVLPGETVRVNRGGNLSFTALTELSWNGIVMGSHPGMNVRAGVTLDRGFVHFDATISNFGITSGIVQLMVVTDFTWETIASVYTVTYFRFNEVTGDYSSGDITWFHSYWFTERGFYQVTVTRNSTSEVLGVFSFGIW